jgi:tetratricopeptide (TPR) repeat protein
MNRCTALTALGLGLLIFGAGSGEAEARGIDAKWLTQPAEQAILNNQFAKAAVLYNGALALRGPEPLLQWRLAQIYTMGGQFTLAQEAYGSFIKYSKDAKKQARAKAEIQRLATAPAPFVSEDVARQIRQRRFAMKSAKLARKLVRKKKYRTAIRFYESALVMDNSLVGVFRLLGTAYGKLKDKKREQAFYIRYLRLRPGGPLAAKVRKRLKGNKSLAKVSFKASFDSAVYINRLPLSPKKKTPFKDVLLPSGTYTIIVYHQKYHAAKKIRLRVKAGQCLTAEFKFAVLMARLKPWARIRANGRDLGLWTEIGLPAGRYKLEFTSDDGTQKMTRRVHLKGGQKLKITRWK